MKKLFLLYISILFSTSSLMAMSDDWTSLLGSIGGRPFNPRDFPFLTQRNRNHPSTITSRSIEKEQEEDLIEKEDTESSSSSTSSSRSSSDSEISTLVARTAERQEGAVETSQQEEQISPAQSSSFWQDFKRSWAIVLAFAGGDEKELFEEEEHEAQQDAHSESSTSSSLSSGDYAHFDVTQNVQSDQFLANTIYPLITTLHLQDPGNIAAIHGPLSAETIRDYDQVFPYVERLIFENITFSDEALTTLSNSFPSAQYLEIRDPGLNTYGSHSSVRTFNERQLTLLLQGSLAHQLTTLIVRSPDLRVSDNTLNLLDNFTQLETICLSTEVLRPELPRYQDSQPSESVRTESSSSNSLSTTTRAPHTDVETERRLPLVSTPTETSEDSAPQKLVEEDTREQTNPESSTSTDSGFIAPAEVAPDTALTVSNNRNRIGRMNTQKLRDAMRANKTKRNSSMPRQAQAQVSTAFISRMRMPRIMPNRFLAALLETTAAHQPNALPSIPVLPQAQENNQGTEYTAIRLVRPDQLDWQSYSYILPRTRVVHLIGYDNYQVNSQIIEQLQITFPNANTLIFDNILFERSGIEALSSSFPHVENLAIRYNINLSDGIFGNQQLITLSQNLLGHQLRNLFLQSPQLHAMENTPESLDNLIAQLEFVYVNSPELPVQELTSEELQELSNALSEISIAPAESDIEDDSTTTTTTHEIIDDAESICINQDDISQENLREEAYTATELRVIGNNNSINSSAIQLLHRSFPQVRTLIFEGVEFNNESIAELANSFEQVTALIISRIDDSLLSTLSRGTLAFQLVSLEIRSQHLTLRATDSVNTLNRFVALKMLSLVNCPLHAQGALNLSRSNMPNQLNVLTVQQVGITNETVGLLAPFCEQTEFKLQWAQSCPIFIFSRQAL